MKPRNLAIFFFLLAGVAMGRLQLANGQAASTTASGNQLSDPIDTDKYQVLQQKLAEIIRLEMEQKDIPAMSIALVAEGQMIWSDGFGFQDAEKQKPASGTSIYRVGSISKLLTDVALMKLVQEGKVDLDQPAVKYLPEFQVGDPQLTQQITLRQLTQHRAGIVRESPVGHYFDPNEPTLEQTVFSLSTTPEVYPAGTRTKYSNAGVSVVGLALQKIAGQSHPDYVRRTVLDPLKMESTSFVKDVNLADQLAIGWMWGYDRPRFLAPDFLLGTGPAGNLYSSMEDLARFSQFIMAPEQHDNAPLEPQTVQQMLEPGKDASGKDLSFGIGFHVQDFLGHRRVGHGGAVYGYSTQLEILPDRQLAVAASSAKDGTNNLVTRICDYALEGMLAIQEGKPLPKYETTVALDRHRAEQMVGFYEAGSGRPEDRVELDLIGDRLLMWQGTFQREVRARSSDGVAIVDDVFGAGTKVDWDGQQLNIGSAKYQRLPDEAPPAVSAELRPYVGEYGWDHNTLYILERNGQLWALIEWFYYYPLTASGPDRFAFPDYGLYHGEELQFVRDPQNQIIKVVAAQVPFEKRQVGTAEGETFKIRRELPVDQLRQLAQEASPPKEIGTYRDAELTELTGLDPSIELDIRYATTNNFMDTVFYQQARAFAQKPAAQAAVRVHQKLAERGLGLLIHDAYRPWQVTKMFWDATPDSMKDFVANPAKGSRHNRGCALDLTLFDRQTGQAIPMVSGYDEFSQRSYPLYPGGTARQRWYRGLLRREMEAADFQVYEFEWWHFDYKDWEKYRIGNLTFDQLDSEGP